jgi:hypothetical protein
MDAPFRAVRSSTSLPLPQKAQVSSTSNPSRAAAAASSTHRGTRPRALWRDRHMLLVLCLVRALQRGHEVTHVLLSINSLSPRFFQMSNILI